jgi:hypothetical protein
VGNLYVDLGGSRLVTWGEPVRGIFTWPDGKALPKVGEKIVLEGAEGLVRQTHRIWATGANGDTAKVELTIYPRVELNSPQPDVPGAGNPQPANDLPNGALPTLPHSELRLRPPAQPQCAFSNGARFTAELRVIRHALGRFKDRDGRFDVLAMDLLKDPSIVPPSGKSVEEWSSSTLTGERNADDEVIRLERTRHIGECFGRPLRIRTMPEFAT